MASARSRSAGRHVRAEQRREHRPPGVGVAGLAVHDGACQDPLGRRRVGQQPGRACDGRVGLDAGVDDGARIAGRVLEPHGGSPRATRTTCGKVDSQSMARCGSAIATDLVDGPVDGRVDGGATGSDAAGGGDGLEPRAPGGLEVVDVRPLVLDLLAEQLELGVRVEGALDQVGDGGSGHRLQRTASRGRVGARAVGGLPAGRGDASPDAPAAADGIARASGRTSRSRSSSPRRARSSQARE